MSNMPEMTAASDAPPKEDEWGKKEAPDKAEQRFLDGPRRRRTELLEAGRIFVECMRGFRKLHFVGPCVTIFGSARFPSTHPYYALTRKLGACLAREGFTVMTGGGPGLMEAGNRGAKDVGGASVGCNILLPKEQKPNDYLDVWVDFRYFFVRKLMLEKYSYAFVAAPGGIGTLDELFEASVLIQTGKMKDFPLVLLGKDYWEPLVSFLRDRLLAANTVDARDVARWILTDSPEEAVAIIKERTLGQFGLKYGERPKRRAWLGE